MAGYLANPVHHSRYLRYKSGISPQEIAAQDNVSVDTVMRSVRDVELQEHLFSAGHLERQTVQTIMACSDLERTALKKALQAKVVVRHPDTLEKIGEEPDYDTQLTAVERLSDIREDVFDRHKPSSGVNVGVAVNVGQSVAGQGRSYEERLRSIDARRRGESREQPTNSGRPQLSDGEVIDVESDADPPKRPATQ